MAATSPAMPPPTTVTSGPLSAAKAGNLRYQARKLVPLTGGPLADSTSSQRCSARGCGRCLLAQSRRLVKRRGSTAVASRPPRPARPQQHDDSLASVEERLRYQLELAPRCPRAPEVAFGLGSSAVVAARHELRRLKQHDVGMKRQ